MDPTILTGRADEHLCAPEDAAVIGAPVHSAVVGPFLQLRDEARSVGFALEAVSGFRSFERQLSIWNRKADGELAVVDDAGTPLDIGRLRPEEVALAILRWSALPGASRHHWGTDVDVIDAAARPPGYEVELIPSEVEAGGMFGPLHEWLDERIAAADAFGFFRPYDRDRGGVAPERWHLSCAPVAAAFVEELTADVLRDTLARADLRLKEVVLDRLDDIFERFVANTGGPPA